MKTADVLINAEQSLIGILLKKNNAFDDLLIASDEFLIESHRIIFFAISELLTKNKNADIITVAEYLESIGKLDTCGNLKYLGSLVESVFSDKNIQHYENIVRTEYKRRKIKALSENINQQVDDKNDVESIASFVESELTNLIEDDKSNVCHIKEAVIEAVEWEDSERKSLSTGLRDLDRLTGGFFNSDLIIIAGRPSMGKSTLAMQIAEHVATKEPVMVFSLEMPKMRIAQRMLRFHADRIGKSQAIAHIYGLHLHIDDMPAVTLQHIKSRCRTQKRKYGLSMVVIDYLQLMRGKGNTRNEEIGSITRGLKELAKEFDIPVLALSQLSREVDKRSDKRPVMSDLRESGEIEQDADQIFFIYRDEVYDKDSQDKGIAEIICRKNRNGSIGDVATSFNGTLTRFSDFNGERVVQRNKTPIRGFSVI